MKISMASVLWLGLFLALPLSAATIHVPGDQPTIQAGIDIAVNGDIVLVADGSWTGSENKNLDFVGKAITVQSANGPESCTIDCQSDGRGFIFQSGEGELSVVEGFTITNGLHGSGGAIHCTGSSPAIREMVISQCRGMEQGGGIYCEDASPTIVNCVIDRCLSDHNGGGIYCLNASPQISGCTISDNDNTEHYPDDGRGGGIACFEDSSPVVTDTTFSGNHAGLYGAGMYCAAGSPVVRSCNFESNTAERSGGGILCTDWGSPEITGCSFTGNEGLIYGSGGIGCGSIGGLIADNLVHDNTGGISAGGSILVTGNTVTNNTVKGGIDSGGSTTITNNVISGNTNDTDGGGISCGSSFVVISQNTITNNQGRNGGGIYCTTDNGEISGNLISGNVATESGGGICTYTCLGSSFVNNMIVGNSAWAWGGGIYTGPGNTASFISNLVANNTAGRGGGIACRDGRPRFWNMTVTGNSAAQKGGGFLTLAYTNTRVINAIIWGNSAPEGSQICVTDDPDQRISRLTLEYSDVEGGQAGALVDPGCGLNWWAGMIDADPLFTSGPLGAFYLGHIESDQPETSPCVDAGDPSAGIVGGTTRTDEVPDTATADMGFHYLYGAAWSRPYVVAGLGPGPDNPSRIRVFPPEQDADWVQAFQAYAALHYGVTLACGDVNGDGGDDLLTGPGPGEQFGPHVRGFTVAGGPLPGLSFFAYGTHKYGVNVAAGDLDGDGFDEIVTGAGPGAVFGPHIRGWNYDGRGVVTPMPRVSFSAYNTPKWGVNVSAGDIDGDGYDEIVTGAGPGPIYGAHVRGWNVDGADTQPIPGVSFFAYNTPRYGVCVGCGDIDGDGMDEIVTAPGPSPAFGAHIRGWNYDGSTLTAMPGVSFFAWPPDQVRHGATISSGADLNGDGRNEIVVGAGPDPNIDTLVKVFIFDGSQTTLWFSLQAFPDGWTHGASVTAGRF